MLRVNFQIENRYFTLAFKTMHVRENFVHSVIGRYYKIIGESRIVFGIKKRLMGTVIFTRVYTCIRELYYLLTEVCRS